MRLDWRTTVYQAFFERGFYKVERDTWGEYTLTFHQCAPGWPRCEPVRIEPERDADGNAQDWASLDAAMAAAERHASLFDAQIQRKAG